MDEVLKIHEQPWPWLLKAWQWLVLHGSSQSHCSAQVVLLMNVQKGDCEVAHLHKLIKTEYKNHTIQTPVVSATWWNYIFFHTLKWLFIYWKISRCNIKDKLLPLYNCVNRTNTFSPSFQTVKFCQISWELNLFRLPSPVLYCVWVDSLCAIA